MLALPVFILEMGSHLIPAFHMWIMDTIGQYNSWLLQFALTTLVLVFPGRRFTKRDSSPMAFSARHELSSGSWNLGCLQFSVVATFMPHVLPQGTVNVYFEAAAVIVSLILLGRYFEAKAKGRTSQAIQHLVGMQPKLPAFSVMDR